MAKAKRGSIRKRGKAALALGAAGFSLAMPGGASATAPATVSPQDDAHRFILGEEEISDVSLATFQVFDRENPPLSQNIRVAAKGCGCGGCGCGHPGGGCARACGGGGCAAARPAMSCAFGAARPAMTPGFVRPGGPGVVRPGGPGFVRPGFRCRCACRGGCACGGAFIGVACLGCGGCYGTCWQWDPYLGQWVYVCY
jgi:hypothetical protein